MDEIDIATITKRSVHGILALTSRTFVLQLISFVAFIVISSALQPKDIGIYTAVIAMQRIISFFTDFGLGAALVQKKHDLTHEDLKTSFTIQMSITLVIFLLIVALQGPIAYFFKLPPSGVRLLLALVFTIFLSSFKTIPSILLERHIQFSKLVIPQIAESLAFNLVLIVLVLNKFGVDSYTWAFLISGIIGIPFYYAVSPWKVGLGIDRESLRHLKFGLQYQAKNILATVKDDFLTVILVKFLSFSQIGYIGFAQRLAFFVYRYVVDSVTKVTFSTYARIQQHDTHMRTAIEKSLFFVSAVMFPMLIGIIITSPYLIHYFPKWHNKWEPAILSLIFFCLNAMISSLSGILVNVLDATGHVKTTLRLMAIWTTMTWILTPLSIRFYGYNGVAIASFIVALTILYTVKLVKDFIPFSFFKSIAIPSVCSLVMGIVVYFFALALIRDLITLIFVILIGGVVYSLSFLLLAREQVMQDIRKISAKA